MCKRMVPILVEKDEVFTVAVTGARVVSASAERRANRVGRRDFKKSVHARATGRPERAGV